MKTYYSCKLHRYGLSNKLYFFRVAKYTEFFYRKTK